MGRFGSAELYAADGAVAAAAFPGERLRHRVRADSGGCDLLGSRKVLFDQYRGNGQRFADIVKTVAGIVRGEIFIRAKRHAQKVANRIGVFVAVQAARHDSAGIGFNGTVGLLKFALHVANKVVDIRLRRARNSLRRHFSTAQFSEDILPLIAVCKRIGSLKRLQIQAAGGQAVVMATCAGIRKDRLDGGVEGRLSREDSGNGRCRESEPDEGSEKIHYGFQYP